MSRIHRRTRGSRGQALVEFSLVIPIFLLLLIALFDLGRGVFAYNTLTNAAREGARMAIVNQDTATIIADAKARRRSSSSTTRASSSASTRWPTTAARTSTTRAPRSRWAASPSCRSRPTYRPITPLISNIVFGMGVKFSALSVLSVEYQCPNGKFTASQCPNH